MALPVYLAPGAREHAGVRELTVSLVLPTAEAGLSEPALIVEYRKARLQIRNSARRERPWYVDFSSARHNYRRTRGGGVSQPLARAVGIKGPGRPRVVDATAGWGRDAFVLASLGCTLELIERDAIVATLLADGLRRAADDSAIADIVARMHLHHTDAHDYLRGLSGETAPDAVYLDPMYPPGGKHAAVKKELRLLRELLCDSPGDTALLDAACACARERVVVKRPKAAVPLGGHLPDTRIASPNTRYDIYLTNR